jgi:hypothetical protein
VHTGTGRQAEDGLVSAHEFRDDDAGYLAWLAEYPDGLVLNIARSHHPAEAKLHRATCWSIGAKLSNGKTATSGQYVKVCAAAPAEIEQWASDRQMLPPPCGACHPTAGAPEPTRAAGPIRRRARPPLPEGRALVVEPTTERREVQVWTDDYLRYGKGQRPPWQQDLRTTLRAHIRELNPAPDQILHATLCVDKPDGADVENLVLFNIDAFGSAGRHGIRFELGAAVPPAPDGADYPVHYRYGLQPRAAAFQQWQAVRRLASFDWTDLGASFGDGKVAPVWLAVAHSQADVAEIPLAAETPFAVTVEIRPPHNRHPRPDLKMKAVFDGVIAAFQTHTDTAVLDDVARRLATVLPCDAAEITRHLHDDRRAVLGAVPQLVRPNNAAGVWNPGDHWCLVGQLLAVEPVDSRWAIRGEVVEIRPAD